MTKTKRIVSFILCIALSISLLSVVAFACTLYKSGVIRDNIETAHYNNAGTYQYSTFSWGGTNNHPSFSYTENFRNVPHRGTLNKTGYYNAGTSGGSPGRGDYTRVTIWRGSYAGNIFAPSHP